MRSSAPSPSPPPSLIRCPELDLSVRLSPAPPAGPRPSGPSGPWDSSGEAPYSDNSAVVTRADLRPPTGSGGTDGCHGVDFEQREEPPASAATERPGGPEGAELNTTLALKAELRALQETEFNSQRAVREALQKSPRTKNLIDGRAAEGLNLARSLPLFTSLVSVDVRVDGIRRVARDRLLPAPPPCRRDDRTAAGSPSPLLFMTGHLLRQKPLPSEKELDGDEPLPPSHAAGSTFDLRRRQACWEL